MNRTTFLATLAIALAAATEARAQQASAPIAIVRTDSAVSVGVVLTSPSDSSLREVERAAGELASAVQATVMAAMNKPEVRVAALQVAASAIALAQQSLVQNIAQIQTALAIAAREIEAVRKAQAKVPAKTPVRAPAK